MSEKEQKKGGSQDVRLAKENIHRAFTHLIRCVEKSGDHKKCTRELGAFNSANKMYYEIMVERVSARSTGLNSMAAAEVSAKNRVPTTEADRSLVKIHGDHSNGGVSTSIPKRNPTPSELAKEVSETLQPRKEVVEAAVKAVAEETKKHGSPLEQNQEEVVTADKQREVWGRIMGKKQGDVAEIIRKGMPAEPKIDVQPESKTPPPEKVDDKSTRGFSQWMDKGSSERERVIAEKLGKDRDSQSQIPPGAREEDVIVIDLNVLWAKQKEQMVKISNKMSDVNTYIKAKDSGVQICGKVFARAQQNLIDVKDWVLGKR